MTTPHIGYKRMVVGLPQSSVQSGAVATVADLAELLRMDVLATFVTEATLPSLAASTAVRELRGASQGWQTIDPLQLNLEFDRAAAAARRSFTEATRNLSVNASFDVISAAELATSLIRTDDMVAIIEPSHPGERVTRQFTCLLDAATQIARAILIVPKRLIRTSGPVMALASDPEDASIEVGLKIAAALNEQLLLVTPRAWPSDENTAAAAERLGVQLKRMIADDFLKRALSLAEPLPAQERLRVVTRKLVQDDLQKLFSMLRGIPLLMVGAEGTEAAAVRRDSVLAESSERA